MTYEEHPNAHSHEAFRHAFDDVDRLVREFDSPDRDEWQMPADVIRELELSDTSTVVEVGAGTGYFAVKLAGHLPLGNVIALETQSKLVEHIRNRVRALGLTNLEVRTVTPDEFDIRGNSDLVLFVDVYHHISDRVAYIERIKKDLKPGGTLAVIDRRPKPHQHGTHRVSPGIVKAELGRAGFDLLKELVFLPVQYFLIFKIKDERTI